MKINLEQVHSRLYLKKKNELQFLSAGFYVAQVYSQKFNVQKIIILFIRHKKLQIAYLNHFSILNYDNLFLCSVQPYYQKETTIICTVVKYKYTTITLHTILFVYIDNVLFCVFQFLLFFKFNGIYSRIHSIMYTYYI